VSCKDCDNKSLDKGVGDTLARLIAGVTGAKPCEGCNKRKEKLNNWLPYKNRGKKP